MSGNLSKKQLDNELINSVNNHTQDIVVNGNGSNGNLMNASSVGTPSSVSNGNAVSSSPVIGDLKKGKQRTRELIRTEDKDESVLKKIGEYLVPLLGLMVFILLIAFVYVPFGTEAIERNKEADALQEEINWTNEKIEALKSVDLDDLNDQIAFVEKVVRDRMDVSDLAAQVEEIAEFNNLKPREITFSNRAVSSSAGGGSGSEKKWIPDYAKSISGPFSFYGELKDIVSFLGDLRSSSPTVLFIDAVNVSRYELKDSEGNIVDKELWSVDITIFGYTCPPVEKANLKDPFSANKYEDLMEEIDRRIKLKQEREDILYPTGTPVGRLEDEDSINDDNQDNDNTVDSQDTPTNNNWMDDL